LKGAVSYHEREIAELAVAYLRAAMAALDNPEERAGGLLRLRAVAKAYGALGALAAEAGISREALDRALS
jgi:DNA-binding phage protein